MKLKISPHLSRRYNERVIDDTFKRLEGVTREEALKKVTTNRKNKRPVLALTFDPRLPDVQKVMSAAYTLSRKSQCWHSENKKLLGNTSYGQNYTLYLGKVPKLGDQKWGL